MKKKVAIYCTIGPKSINKNFLSFLNKKASLVRINMSHINVINLNKTIKLIRKYCSVPICIDTEGAQIRTKIKKDRKYKKGNIGYIYKKKGGFNLYPENIFEQLKRKDILDIGFDNLKIKIIKKFKNKIAFKTVKEGSLQNNKGTHLANRKIRLNFLTKKDLKAIGIAKKLKIKNFALSFTNSHREIKKFNSLLPNQKKIFKIETKNAIKNLDKMFRYGKHFLIDRGDLSKEIPIEKIPIFQRYIFHKAKKFKKVKIYVATNYLESMINKPYPTRGEANDIYNSLEMGADGLVLSAETAIGNFPKESVIFLSKVIRNYYKSNKFTR